MGDLISRQEAIDALNRLCPYPGEWSVNGLGLCKDAIANLPSIDAVPVIRCKDCKHNPKKDKHGIKCPCATTGDPFLDWIPDDDWFCADGESEEECTQ